MDTDRAPLAYKYVATKVMLLEVNYCVSRLQLPLGRPVEEQHIRRLMIPHPRVIGFAGRIDTPKYGFTFAKSGRLRYIEQLYEGTQYIAVLQPPEGMSIREYHEQLSRRRSVIDTDGAYRLASNWLALIEVDVPRLEREKPPPRTEHWVSMNRYTLPIFTVEWGDQVSAGRGPFKDSSGRIVRQRGPAVIVNLTGDTKELVSLRQEDDSFSRRPAELIKDMDKLLAIPDEEFRKYSESERSNLVARFTAVTYPIASNQPAAAPKPKDTENR